LSTGCSPELVQVITAWEKVSSAIVVSLRSIRVELKARFVPRLQVGQVKEATALGPYISRLGRWLTPLLLIMLLLLLSSLLHACKHAVVLNILLQLLLLLLLLRRNRVSTEALMRRSV
jgi:hypothetical protein